MTQRGDGLSISVELINAQDNSQIWGQQYNRKLADVFAVQEEIAKEISEKLRLKLTGAERQQLAKRRRKTSRRSSTTRRDGRTRIAAPARNPRGSAHGHPLLREGAGRRPQLCARLC